MSSRHYPTWTQNAPTIAEAAQTLGVSVRRIYQIINAQKWRTCRVDRGTVVHPEDIAKSVSFRGSDPSFETRINLLERKVDLLLSSIGLDIEGEISPAVARESATTATSSGKKDDILVFAEDLIHISIGRVATLPLSKSKDLQDSAEKCIRILKSQRFFHRDLSSQLAVLQLEAGLSRLAAFSQPDTVEQLVHPTVLKEIIHLNNVK